ncbi:MAG: YbjN domain-containing protein [Spirochaetota bacterium]
MPISPERQSKRFHITFQVPDLEQSVREYSEILGETPCCVIADRLALWRTGELNLLLRARPKQRMAVLQLGLEFDYLESTQRFKDCNQLSWLFFSTHIQDEAINRLNAKLEYNEDSDFLLELRNPNARWNFRISLMLILAMTAFTILNHDWLTRFFAAPKLPEQTETLRENPYSINAQLRTVGSLLQEAGYQTDYLQDYAIARKAEHANITFQVINGQILFATYWSLPTYNRGTEQENIYDQINQINRTAIMCRYYQDEDGDLAVEAWFSLPRLLLIGAKDQNQGAALSEHRKQAETQWQKTLNLWQQESLSWLQSSPLFGGGLDPEQSFSKKVAAQ